MSGENVPQITILHWKQLLMTKGGNLENRRWKILGCPSEKYLVVQVRNTWTNRSHFWHIWTRQEINWALSIRRWPHATFTCMLQPCKYLLSHLWLYKLYFKGRHQKKKNVFFRALPKSPKPPLPMTPIRATWSSFFGSRNSRFESQFRTKNTICTI